MKRDPCEASRMALIQMRVALSRKRECWICKLSASDSFLVTILTNPKHQLAGPQISHLVKEIIEP